MTRLLATIAAAFALAAAVASAASADPAANQLITGNALQAGIAAGTFIAQGPCPSGSQAVTFAQLTTCIRNNGGCTSNPTGSLPKWADAMACRVLTTTINQLNDPWFTLGANTCCWTGSNSTPSFVPDTSMPGAPGNAQSLTNGTIVQNVSPASLLSATPIVFRIQINESSVSRTPIDCAGDLFDPVTVSGSTLLQVVGPGNVTVASQTFGGGGWHTVTLSTVASAGAGTYALLVRQSTNSASVGTTRIVPPHAGDLGGSSCVDGATTISAGGKASGASVGNS